MNNHISQSDAEAQKLNGFDTYKNSHIIYINDLNRDMAVIRLCTEAYRSFADTIIIQYRHQIQSMMAEWNAFERAGGILAGARMPNDAINIIRLNYINLENLKIASGFELCLKAILLQEKYVVQEIDRKSAAYQALSVEQSRRPIGIDEIFAIDSFRFNGSLNYIPGLKSTSIKLSTMLEEEKYRIALNISTYDLGLIDEYRDLRNQIHFPGDYPETPKLNAHPGSGLDFLVNFINKEVVGRVNQLAGLHDHLQLRLDVLA